MIELENIPLFFHLISLIVGFGSVIVIDTFGLLYLLKKVKLSVVMQTASVTQILIWIGWSGLVLSGGTMIGWQFSDYRPLQFKIFLVMMLGVNGLVLHWLKSQLTARAAADLAPTQSQLILMGLCSTVSQLGWWGAILIGYFVL